MSRGRSRRFVGIFGDIVTEDGEVADGDTSSQAKALKDGDASPDVNIPCELYGTGLCQRCTPPSVQVASAEAIRRLIADRPNDDQPRGEDRPAA